MSRVIRSLTYEDLPHGTKFVRKWQEYLKAWQPDKEGVRELAVNLETGEILNVPDLKIQVEVHVSNNQLESRYKMENARLNITWNGQNGDLVDPVPFDLSKGDILRVAEEAVRGGSVPGILADPDVNFSDFEVDRFSANEQIPQPRLFVRPKTPVGAI